MFGCFVMGPCGIEPQTSCTSSMRSSQLSYEPIHSENEYNTFLWRVQTHFYFPNPAALRE